MTIFILLAIVAGETFWLHRLGAFNGPIAWSMAVFAAGAALVDDFTWSGLAALIAGALT